jgi:hypothetical protein
METLFLIAAVFGGSESPHDLDAPVDFDAGGGHFQDAAVDSHHDVAGDSQHGGAVSGHGRFDTAALFRILSFKAIVAALTFFGLGGLAAQSADLASPQALVIALACGAAALVGMHKLLRLLTRFNADGSLRLDRAIGKTGTVYLAIPAADKGAGKVHLKLQNRLVELDAVNATAERIPAGATIVVVGLAGADSVEVEPSHEPADTTP